MHCPRSFPARIRCAALPMLILGACLCIRHQETPPPEAPNPTSPVADHPTTPPTSVQPLEDGLNQVLTQIVLDSVPREFSDNDDWGKTARRWNGVRLRRDGWKLETERDWATVNHGVWQKAKAVLVDPEHRFKIELTNLQPRSATESAFDLTLQAPLEIEVRQSHWVNGVQLYSVSADLRGTIILKLGCELAIRLSESPDGVIQFQPHVTTADLQLQDFQVIRVSKLGGEFAQQVTKLAESFLTRQIDSQETKIVEKLNRQIAKHSNRLKVTLPELAQTSWGKLVLPRIPAVKLDAPTPATPRDR